MQQLADKFDDLSDAERSEISYAIAATRQSNLLKVVLDNFTDSMNLAAEATETQGNALENEEKYLDSFSGRMQDVSTAVDTFYVHLLNKDEVKNFITLIGDIVKAADKLIETLGVLPTLSLVGGGLLSAKGAGGRKMHPSRISLYICLQR